MCMRSDTLCSGITKKDNEISVADCPGEGCVENCDLLLTNNHCPAVDGTKCPHSTKKKDPETDGDLEEFKEEERKYRKKLLSNIDAGANKLNNVLKKIGK